MYSKIKFLALLTVTSLALFACGTSTSNNSTTTSSEMASTSSVSSSSSMSSTSSEMATFTLEELSQYTGKNGEKAYVAVDGVVYDVTNVPAWKNGEHQNGLTAGKDLSKEILSSPHGKSVLENLPVVGKLVK
jgi:predicted heme/steroid binding protein